MKLVIISAAYNAVKNLDNLCQPIDRQDDDRWEHVIIDDMSDASDAITDVNMREYAHKNRKLIVNTEKKWALRNVVECARGYQDDDDVIIGTVDADDMLSNSQVVRWVLNAYEKNQDVDVIWTAHEWDVKKDMNVSRAMPNNIDPYAYQWCTSHFRTFRASLLKKISDENFKDASGKWFTRGYDQALMLPVLHVGRDRGYIDRPCYTYNIDSVSLPISSRAGSECEQIHNIAFVRARGFVE